MLKPRFVRLMSWSALLLALLLTANPAPAADYFGKPQATEQTQTAAPPADQAATDQALPQSPAAAQLLPAPLRSLLADAMAVQIRLNNDLRTQLRLARHGDTWGPSLAIIGLSFLYGVFHAVGPGHGKVVVGGYFLTRRARISHGLLMSLTSAMVQSLSAIVLVGGLAALFKSTTQDILNHAAWLEEASYAVIALIGLWMAWGVITGRVCCDHDHGQEGHVCGHDHGHAHQHDHGESCSHDHGGCGCGHHHDGGHHHHEHHHDHGTHDHRDEQRREVWQVLTTGAAVGLRPCSGAILVLLFTLTNGLLWIGVLSTLAMGLGVAITVSVISLGGLGMQRAAAHLGKSNEVLARRARKLAALSGALLISLFGLAQFVAMITGIITPTAG